MKDMPAKTGNAKYIADAPKNPPPRRPVDQAADNAADETAKY